MTLYKKRERLKNMKQNNFLKSVCNLAIPVAIQSMLQSSFSIVDQIMIGQLGSAGVLESAYLIDDMTVEIIADGVHLPKPLLQFVYKFKGPKKTALCTDAMRGAGMPDGDSILGSLKNGQRVIIEDGVAKMPDRTAFAGSVATTDRLVRTMIEVAEVPLVDAVQMMTQTPAEIIGVADRKGSLEAGKDADIVIFDEGIQVHYTISEGTIIYSK